jgi:hypothetical protein
MGWHRISDDVDHEPDWIAFAVDDIVRRLYLRLNFEAWADAKDDE